MPFSSRSATGEEAESERDARGTAEPHRHRHPLAPTWAALDRDRGNAGRGEPAPELRARGYGTDAPAANPTHDCRRRETGVEVPRRPRRARTCRGRGLGDRFHPDRADNGRRDGGRTRRRSALEAARRNGRILFVRYPESSPHATGLQRAGLISYREEHLFALPRTGRSAANSAFRAAARSDRAGTFRLYCKAVPQHVRRSEALTQQEWRAVIDSFDCEKEYVAEGDRGIVAWAGFGERECHLILEPGIEGLSDAALDLIESHGPRHGTLVLGDDQDGLHDRAAERGYTAMGVRLVCARRLAQLQSLKEVSPLPAESLA